MLNRDEVIAMANNSGASIVGGGKFHNLQCWNGDISFDDESLQAFYAAAYLKGVEDAIAKIKAQGAVFYQHESGAISTNDIDMRAGKRTPLYRISEDV